VCAQGIGESARSGVRDEVIVGDNGSTEGSVEIAEAERARVIHVAHKA